MLPVNANYRCKRTMMLGGQRVEAGSLLPQDSPLRRNPRRLEILYRTRQIEPAEHELAPSPKAVTQGGDLLASLSLEEVKLILEARGMNTRGKDEAVRERLRAALQ